MAKAKARPARTGAARGRSPLTGANAAILCFTGGPWLALNIATQVLEDPSPPNPPRLEISFRGFGGEPVQNRQEARRAALLSLCSFEKINSSPRFKLEAPPPVPKTSFTAPRFLQCLSKLCLPVCFVRHPLRLLQYLATPPGRRRTPFCCNEVCPGRIDLPVLESPVCFLPVQAVPHPLTARQVVGCY